MPLNRDLLLGSWRMAAAVELVFEVPNERRMTGRSGV
jgi:hypothetical protein